MTTATEIKGAFDNLDTEVTEADVEITWTLHEKATTDSLSAKCCICHRALRNLKSQQRGMGPVCARKAGRVQMKLL